MSNDDPKAPMLRLVGGNLFPPPDADGMVDMGDNRRIHKDELARAVSDFTGAPGVIKVERTDSGVTIVVDPDKVPHFGDLSASALQHFDLGQPADFSISGRARLRGIGHSEADIAQAERNRDQLNQAAVAFAHALGVPVGVMVRGGTRYVQHPDGRKDDAAKYEPGGAFESHPFFLRRQPVGVREGYFIRGPAEPRVHKSGPVLEHACALIVHCPDLPEAQRWYSKAYHAPYPAASTERVQEAVFAHWEAKVLAEVTAALEHLDRLRAAPSADVIPLGAVAADEEPKA